ncbi:MAG: DUF2027 domain-containing protein [Bacteroidetes bacterium]|nr:DUF2027 domain-containing protein [Bacteroidota bacterium]
MKYKIGDKVKFLNESGGGVVSKIISPKMVNVMIEDGFEIPVMTSELLKIELDAPVDSPVHMFREDFHADLKPSIEENHYEADDRTIPLTNNKARGTVADGIYFAFVPHDQKWLITGLLDVYLVNNTSFDILYSIFLEKEEGGFMGFDYGSAEPSSMILLQTLERDQLNQWEKGILQVLFHPEEGSKLMAPGNSGFKIKLPRFYIESSYKDSGIIDGKSILVSLITLTSLNIIAESNAPQRENTEPTLAKAEIVEPENIIDKHRTSPYEAVVDLHIGELVDNMTGVDNAAMLRIQVNYFTRCLENAMANKLHKVTFIHGVGTGVLKTALKEILKEYPNVEYQDASMKQFGYGALDVIIRN